MFGIAEGIGVGNVVRDLVFEASSRRGLCCECGRVDRMRRMKRLLSLLAMLLTPLALAADPVQVNVSFPSGLTAGKVPVTATGTGLLPGAKVSVAVDPGKYVAFNHAPGELQAILAANLGDTQLSERNSLKIARLLCGKNFTQRLPA